MNQNEFGFGTALKEGQSVSKYKGGISNFGFQAFLFFLVMVFFFVVSWLNGFAGPFYTLAEASFGLMAIFAIICLSLGFWKYSIIGYSVIYWVDKTTGNLCRRLLENDEVKSSKLLLDLLGEHIRIKLGGLRGQSYYCPEDASFDDCRQIDANKLRNKQKRILDVRDGWEIVTHEVILQDLHGVKMRVRIRKAFENNFFLSDCFETQLIQLLSCCNHLQRREQKLQEVVDYLVNYLVASSRLGKSKEAVVALAQTYNKLITYGFKNQSECGVTAYNVRLTPLAENLEEKIIHCFCLDEKMVRIWARSLAVTYFKDKPVNEVRIIITDGRAINEIPSEPLCNFTYQLPGKAAA